jgi:hypothetical protein
MAKLVIKGGKKYLTWLEGHLAKEHRKTKGKTKLRR